MFSSFLNRLNGIIAFMDWIRKTYYTLTCSPFGLIYLIKQMRKVRLILILQFIHSIIMGNVCQGDNECLNPTIREQMRHRSLSEGNQDLTLKKFIQFKKMKLTEQYSINKLIGQGSYGSVYKVIHRQTKAVKAAKRIQKQARTIQSLDEYLMLKRLDHPSIIRLYDIYSQKKYLYIVMDYCAGGELFDRIIKQGNLTQNQARLYIKQLLSGIQHCHSNGIMHRDLKPQNIMFLDKKQKDLKIIDFGVGTSFKQNTKTTLKVGSIYYIAPEVIKKKYNYKCDIWSIGVILYILLTGRPPFVAKNDKQIYKLILKAKVPFPQDKWDHLSSSAKNLVEKMLEADPEKRISGKEALNHPWIKLDSENGGRKLLQGKDLKVLKQFCEMNQFQTAIMAYITHNFVDSQILCDLQDKFKSMDSNGDGKISWQQFHSCISETMSAISQSKIIEMFDTIDKNHSGFIDYSEFITSSIDKVYLKNENLVERAFEMMDKDKNGFLSRGELLDAFGGCSDDLEKYIMEQFDINKDGIISKQQFKLAMKGLLKK